MTKRACTRTSNMTIRIRTRASNGSALARRAEVSRLGCALFPLAFARSRSFQQTMTEVAMAFAGSRGRAAFFRCVLAGVMSVLCMAQVAAVPITYAETATISGSLDGVPFVDAVITITGSGDTDNIVHGMPCCFRNNLGVSTVTFDLAGFGT